MAIQRLDDVSIVVEDLEVAIAFFTELGMDVEGRAELEGPVVDQTVGLDGVHTAIAMMRTPDGHGRLELASYFSPTAIALDPLAPNTIGFHRVMFAVDDIDDTIARLRPHGGTVLGEVAQYEDLYRLCYLRGPSGIVIGLAESLG